MTERPGALLIGGNGFYGLALGVALAREGYRVHAVSRHAVPGRRNGIEFHQGGQDERAVIEPLLCQCPSVVHLASTTTPGSSARRPQLDARENLLPAAGLIELLAANPPQRLIFVSSGGAIYGNPRNIPVDESAAPQPLSYHAAAKVALESLFGAFAHAHKVSLAILRPSNLYGPGQPLRHGFGFVRTLLDKALHNEPIEIWGDGSAVRDYLFIDDAVDGCLRLLERPAMEGVFNLGSGTGTSLAEMITRVEQATGRRLLVAERPARGTDVHAIVLDSARLHDATGWAPDTALEQGLQRTWDWLRKAGP